MSRIEWTELTWNPVRGCSRVSPGCDNCYAMRQARRFDVPGGRYESLTRRRKSDGAVDWSGHVRPIWSALDVPFRRRKPTVWFVNSMSDLFHESLMNAQIAAVFGVMAACPQHTFQVLTKRADRMPRWFEWVERLECDPWTECHAAALANDPNDLVHTRSEDVTGRAWPLPNVWLGVSAEDQQWADVRIPHLLATPAAVRFVSAEPLLGPIDFDEWIGPAACMQDTGLGAPPPWIDWIIVGGESGPKARPCAIEWITSVVEQCQRANVPVFVKQLGSRVVSEQRTCTEDEMRTFVSAKLDDWTPGPHDRAPNGEFWAWRAGLVHRKGGNPTEWPQALNVRQMPEVQP